MVQHSLPYRRRECTWHFRCRSLPSCSFSCPFKLSPCFEKYLFGLVYGILYSLNFTLWWYHFVADYHKFEFFHIYQWQPALLTLYSDCLQYKLLKFLSGTASNAVLSAYLISYIIHDIPSNYFFCTQLLTIMVFMFDWWFRLYLCILSSQF